MNPQAQQTTTPSPDIRRDIAREAYLFAYPLVLSHVTNLVGTNVEEPRGTFAPINQITHMRDVPDENWTIVVRPNADTLYSPLVYEVSQEPLVVIAPDAGDRYYLLQCFDLWTDIFAAPGTRTTGNAAHTFAIAGPDWQGTLPEGVRLYRSPTNQGTMIGRVQVNGKDDHAAVHAFQDRLSVVPLSAYGTPYTPPKGKMDLALDMSPPPDQVDAMDAASFFELFAHLMKRNPPHVNDAPMVDRLARIGIVPGESFEFARAPEDVQAALNDTPSSMLPLIKPTFVNSGIYANGWKTNLTAIGTYGTDYLHRAGVAYGGWGANVPQDAIYPSVTIDQNGDSLRSDHQYVLHFDSDQLPPARAFWSLTMYDDRQLFTANPLHRYAIGDRDALAYNADGSLDLSIQRESPGADREANWLPAPQSGEFTLNLRIYWPTLEATMGQWSPPPVLRVG
jgi:hypothetical protein